MACIDKAYFTWYCTN